MTKLLSTRRNILRGASAASTLLVAPNIARAQAKELRVLIAGGSWRDFFHQTFSEPFAKAKNVEITYRLGLSFEPMIMAQRRSPQWDIIHQSQSRSTWLGSLGILREWDPAKVPNVNKVHKAFRYEFNVGKIHTPYGICVNTKEIKKPITSWNDLWDPAFKGKVAFPAWPWMGEEVFHALNVMFGGTAENIDPGIARLKALFKENQAKVINNVEHTRQLLVAGEVWICPYFGARTEQAAAAGAPVEFVMPNEGGLSWIWNTSLIAGRPGASQALAEEFVNTTLDAEKQLQFARLTSYPPTNIDAMNNIPADLAKLRIPMAEIEKIGELQRRTDYLALFSYRDQHVERWNKEVLAG
jgi:putative spermidine/putrescine transport system substrate-binding protein